MNMIDIQDKLKNLSEDQLIKEMQMPSGQAPQFLVLSEITRRKKMRDGMKAAEAKQGVPSVAEEVVAAAAVPQQGLPQMASAMAPKSSIEQNTGIASLPVQRMASGGLVQKMAEGGRVVVRNGKRFIEQEDGTLVPETRTMSMFENLRQAPSEIAAIPAQLGAAARDLSAGFAGQMNADLARSGDEAMRRQMAEDVYGMRAGPDTSYQYPPMPMVDTAPMDQVAMALEGRSGFPTGMPTPQQLAMAAAQPQLPPAPLPAFGPGFEYGGRNDQIDPRILAMAAAQPNLPPAPPSAFGPGFEYGGRGSEVDLDLTSPTDYVGPRPLTPDQMAAAAAAQPQMPPPDAGLLPGPTFEAGRGVDLQRAPNGRVITPLEGTDGLSQIWDFLTTPVDPTVSMAPPMPDTAPPQQRADRDQQGFAVEEESALPPDAPEEAAPPAQTIPQDVTGGGAVASNVVGGGGGTGGGQGGSGGASGQGGFVSELESALARAERTKEQDKWLALAQAGLALMASDQPTLGGAIGEAGQVGIEAFRGARDTYEQSRMSILEAIAAQRAAAARAAGGGRGGGSGGLSDIPKMISAINSDLEWMTTEVTGYNDAGQEVTERVPIKGYEGTVADLKALRLQLANKSYGLNSLDATQ